jgi:hypothetical protein
MFGVAERTLFACTEDELPFNRRDLFEEMRAALDKLPALDADGRWEKLRSWCEAKMRDHHYSPITYSSWREVIREINRLTSGEAAQREE